MSHLQIQNLLNKVQNSCSYEIQRGAIKTIISKIQCGILTIEELIKFVPDAPVLIIKWTLTNLQSKQIEIIQSIFETLASISKVNIGKTLMKDSVYDICKIREICFQKNIGTTQLEITLSNISEGQTYHPLENKSENTATFIPDLSQTQSIKVLQKPNKQFQEYIQLPQVYLSEIDEKVLFDSSVALKYGNNQTILNALKDNILNIIRDFPIEVFKQKNDIIEDLIIQINASKEDTIIYYCLRIIKKILQKLIKRYQPIGGLQNINQDSQIFQKETRDYIIHAYPSLNPKEQLEERSEKKSFKDIIELIIIGLFQNLDQYSGHKLAIFNNILDLLNIVRLKNNEASFETLTILIEQLTQKLDQQEDQTEANLLYPLLIKLGYNCCQSLVQYESVTEINEFNRFFDYLAQAQFSFILTQNESRQLTMWLTKYDSKQLKNANKISQILLALDKLYGDNKLMKNQMILSKEEFEQSVNIYTELLICVPLSDNIEFIKNYIFHYFLIIDNEYDDNQQKNQILLNLEYLFNCPTQTISQYLIRQMISNLNSDQNLGSELNKNNDKSKGNQHQYKTISQLQLQMIQQKEILDLLFNASKNNLQLYKQVIELVALAYQKKPITQLKHFYSLILTREPTKKIQILINSIIEQDSEIEIAQLYINLFSKQAQLRSKSSKTLYNFSSITKQLNRSDFMNELLDESKTQIAYKDELDLYIQEENCTLNIAIEYLSNLETLIMSRDKEFSLRISSADQMARILVYYSKFTDRAIKSAQVKDEQLKSYFESLLSNFDSLLNKLYKLILEEKSISKLTNYSNLIGKLFDIQTVSQHIFETDNLECALYLVSTSELLGARYSSFRYIYVKTFKEIDIEKSLFFELVSLPKAQTINNSKQFWEQYSQIKQSVKNYIQEHQKLLIQGCSTQKQLVIKSDKLNNKQLIYSLDLYIGYKDLQLNFIIDQQILQYLQQLMLSSTFLESGLLFILQMVQHIPQTQNYWINLMNQVHCSYLEAQGLEQIEYLNLYIQLLSVQKQKSDVQKYILQHLPKTQYNPKVASYILKLIKNDLLQLDLYLIKYLSQNILQFSSKSNFEGSKNLINLLRLKQKMPLFQDQDQLDKQILFSRLMQFAQSNIQKIRYLSLNQLSSCIEFIDEDQLQRLEDLSLDGINQYNDSEFSYQMLITITLKLAPISKLKRIISFTEQRLKEIPKNNQQGYLTDFRAGLLKLVYLYLTSSDEDAIVLFQQFQMENVCVKSLIDLKEQNQIFYALHGLQILNFLMRQSVSKSLALLQHLNLLEVLLKALYRIKKIMIKNEFQHPGLSTLILSISQMIQFATHYHKDYIEIEYQRIITIKEKWNINELLKIVIQNDNFQIDDKIGIGKMICCLYSINKLQANDDLVYGLCALFRSSVQEITDSEHEASLNNLKDITQILSSVVANNNIAKIIINKSGIANSISQIINKELDMYVGNLMKTINLKQSNISIKTIFDMSPTLQYNLTFLKLFYKHCDQPMDENINFSEVIYQTIQIIEKWIIILNKNVKDPIIQQLYEIAINMSSNLNLTQALTQQLNQQKWQVLQSLIKQFKLDLNNEQQRLILTLLSVLGQHQDIRLVYIRQKVIENQQERLINNWENKKKWDPINENNCQIFKFLASLSFYKDIQEKLLNNNTLNNILFDTLANYNLEEQTCKYIILLITNCSLNNKLKKTILSNQKFAPLIMNILNECNIKSDIRFKVSQLLCNLFYKCTAAVTIFNKPQVYENFEHIMKDSQRKVDKLRYNQNQLVSKQEYDNQEIQNYQGLSNNISQLLNILQIEW